MNLRWLALLGFGVLLSAGSLVRAGDAPNEIVIGGPDPAANDRPSLYAFQGADPDNDLAKIKIELRTPAGVTRLLRDWTPYTGGWTYQNITFNEGVGIYLVWASLEDAEGNRREPMEQGLNGEILAVDVDYGPALVPGSVSVTPDRSASPGGSVTITASATDAGGDLAWMDFYVNPPNLSGWQLKQSVAISGAASGPVGYVWNIPVGEQTGTWMATVRVRDAFGLEDHPDLAPEILFTVKKQQAAVNSASVAIQSGASFSPSISGGSGTGAYQFSVSNPPHTNFPGHDGVNVGQAGTMLPPPGNQVVTAWTPPAAPSAPAAYEFYVRRWGDAEFYESPPVPLSPPGYTLTVNPNTPSVPAAIGATDILATSFTANWGASTNAIGYKLDVSTVANFLSFVGDYNNKNIPNVTYAAVTNLPTGMRYYFRVRAYNLAGTSDNSDMMQVDLGTPPTFTSASSTVFTQGSFGSFSVTAAGSPAPTVSMLSGTLPDGVSFTPVSGGATLAGTPSQNGTFELTLRAQNVVNGQTQSATQTFTLTVNSVPSPTAFVVSTVAGQPGLTGSSDNPARFNEPSGLASDGTHVYVADQTNHSIRRIAIASGVVTTFASGLNYPAGVAVDGAGNVYAVEWGGHRVKRFNPAGALTLTVGTGQAGYADLGLANSAFCFPQGLAVNAAGTLIYVSDYSNAKVRRIDVPAGAVTTIASGFAPWAIALNPGGTTLYVSDYTNNAIKSIALGPNTVSAVPGAWTHPRGLSVDSLGHLYVADTGSHTIRKASGGSVVTVAGQSGSYGAANGPGPSARFTYPFGIVANTSTSIYVADFANHTIRRLLPDGPPPPSAPEFTSPPAAEFPNGSFRSFTFTASGVPAPAFAISGGSLPPGVTLSGGTIAGTPNLTGPLPATFNFTVTAANASGSASQPFALTVTAATAPAAFVVSTVAGQAGAPSFSDAPPGRFNEPSGLATDGAHVFVADQSNHKIRRLHLASGALASLGSGLLYPTGVAVDAAGHLYVADYGHLQIKRFTPAGALTLTIGSGASGAADADFATSSFSSPMGLAVNAAGTLVYVADYFNACIRRISIGAGTVTTIPLGFQPWNVALDASGATLYVADYSNGLIKALAVPSGGTLTTLPGSYAMPRGLTVDALGNVYVVETAARRIRRITGHSVVTVAGDGAAGSADGPGLAARFHDPFGIVATSTTSLYVADMRNHTIRRMLPDPNAPAFTTAAMPSLAVGYAGSVTFTASGTPAPTFSHTGGALPPGMNFSGATLSGTPSATGAYQFSITATNALGAVTQSFTLTVGTPAAPQIVSQPVSWTAEWGSTVQLRVVATGVPTPTFQWFRNDQPLGSSLGHTGETRDRLTIFGLNAPQGGGGNTGTYKVRVANGVGPAIDSSSVVVAIGAFATNIVPVIDQHPGETIADPADPVTLYVAAHGVGPLHYQWFRNGQMIAGATSPSYVFTSLSGYYHAEVSNNFGAARSNPARVRRTGPPLAAAPSLVEVNDEELVVERDRPFGHYLALADYNVVNGRIVWERIAANWAAVTSLPPGIPSDPITLDSASGLIRGTPSVAGEFLVTYSATPRGEANPTTLQRNLKIVVLSQDDRPWISKQPRSQVVVAGSTMVLLVFAKTVAPSMTYQWHEGGNPLAGETNQWLVRASAQSGDVGNYHVVVSNSKGSTVSQIASISLGTAGSGADPTAGFVFPISVTKPGIATPLQIYEQLTLTTPVTTLITPAGVPAGTPNTATVGDTITFRVRVADVDGDLDRRVMQVFVPDVAEAAQQRGIWSNDVAIYWVDPYRNRGTGNDLIENFPQNGNATNPPDRDVSFVLDAPGIWKFSVSALDTRPGGQSGASARNYLQLEVKNPALSKTPLSVTTQAGRLVGTYFNPGQNHRQYLEMWRPVSGRWDFKWTQNPVLPLRVNWDAPANPGQYFRRGEGWNYQLGWAEVFLESPVVDANYARDIAAELAYCGVDFVILDHTNVVFASGPTPNAQRHNFTNVDNEVMRAATALKGGFKTYSEVPGANNPRIRMTFMLGLTTTWYDRRMDTGHPALLLPIDRRTYRPGQGDEIVWDDPAIAGFLANQTAEFNAVLQKIWDEFANPGPESNPGYSANTGVWQTDPDNGGKPLLLLYVGTDGPAIHRVLLTGGLNGTVPFSATDPLRWRIQVRENGQTVEKRIDQVFSIKYVAAGMASGWAWDQPYRDDQAKPVGERSGVLPFRDRVSRDWAPPNGPSRRFYDSYWTFRENPMHSAAPVGTLNPARTAAEAVHVTAYRTMGEELIQTQMQVAVTLKPRWLILSAWNEFGAASDEPSPDESWTLMPNNKYGRRYSEIVRQKIMDYKQANP